MSNDKVQWTIDLISKLQDANIGDKGRLESIKSVLEEGRTVYESDKNYLKQKHEQLLELEKFPQSIDEKKTSKNMEESRQIQKSLELVIKKDSSDNQNKENDIEDNQKVGKSEVEELREKVKDLEEKVGKRDYIDGWKHENYKSLGVTVLLSLGIGIILLGIGHFYAGKGKRGILWLIGGLIIQSLNGFFLSTSGSLGLSWGPWVFSGIIYFILLIASTLSAASYCKEWNRSISQGISPW